MSLHSLWWPSNVTITFDASEVIEQITTHELERELQERKELIKSDPKEHNKKERYRGDELEVDIDPEEFDLVKQEDIEVSDFTIEQIKEYLAKEGYHVIRSGVRGDNNTDGVIQFIEELPKWKLRELMCDICGITYISSTDDIINSIKEKLC